MGMLISGLSASEGNVPHRKVRIPVSVQNCPSDMFAKDTSIVGRSLVTCECCAPFIEQVVLGDPGAKIAILMRTNSDDPIHTGIVTAGFTSFVEEVNTIHWQRIDDEWKGNKGKRLKRIMKPFTHSWVVHKAVVSLFGL
jgi:hypothetical protein